jgi:predicted enzyme related to lactoylglutathione lyase
MAVDPTLALTMEVLSSRLILRPVDLEGSLRFYGEALGLHVYREYGSGEERGVVFFIGGGFLEVTGTAPPADVDKVSLWLQVPDLTAAHAHLVEAGADIVDPPQRKPWGLDEMWIRDPDGVSIVVVQVPEDHPLRRRL